MTKQRSNYLYELVGIIREKKNNSKKERVGYKLTVEISNLENIPFIQVWQDLIKDQQIWTTIEKDNYIDKKYLFYCQNWMGQYRLINWKELTDHGSN
ncbi:MAG: hypothetical protein LBR43_02340 [Spiroplasmataceae bacterium]|jgi:hypothetical protein|nr:hypothetical protein [Spiroplasmataceae bacterium]